MKKFIVLILLCCWVGLVYGQNNKHAINHPSQFIKLDADRDQIKKGLGANIESILCQFGQNDADNLIRMYGNGELANYRKSLFEKGMKDEGYLIVQLEIVLDQCSYSFVYNDKLYVLTYEPKKVKYWGDDDSKRYRELHLYKRISHNNWVKASPLIDVSYSDDDTDEYHSLIPFTTLFNKDCVDNVTGEYGGGYGSVSVLSNSVVIMFATFGFCPQGVRGRYEYNELLVFIPNKDEYFDVFKYSPINKQTIDPEFVKAGNGIKSVSDTEIVIETWNGGVKNDDIILKVSFGGIKLEGNDKLKLDE